MTPPPEIPIAPPTKGSRSVKKGAAIQITERDREIVTWVCRHGIVTVEQIARKFFPPSARKSVAHLRVQKLCQATPPLLQRDTTYYRQPSVIRVTTAGARLANVGIQPARLVLTEVNHALGIVDLVEAISQQYPDATVLTERERRAERYREKRAGHRKATGRIPDAVFVFPEEKGRKQDRNKAETVAIELDRTARRRMDAETVITAYIAEQYDQVWWYVRPSRVEATTSLTKRMKVDDFITVLPWNGV